MTTNWTENNIPDLRGKTAVITGANSGLGYETARALAAKGAAVILACRNLDKGQQAVAAIQQHTPHATLELMPLNLADLSDVRRFAHAYAQKFDQLHLLINNAGVMATPYRETADGFEMQFGTNHLGHFALTGHLLPLLLATPTARVVTVSSNLHKQGQINFADINGRKSYAPFPAYNQSKLANLLFAYELQRKLESHGHTTRSVAAHPGYAATNLQFASETRVPAWLMRLGNRLMAQDQAMGALPHLYAATADDVQGGDYFGPNGRYEIRGYPTKTHSSTASHDREAAAKLWELSEEMTGVVYPLDTL